MNVTPATHQDVADLLRARTKDATGTELGHWSDDTRPTPQEVTNLLVLATSDVLAQTGSDLSESDGKAARSMIALRGAMLVELSYFPEQVRSDRSAYPEYERLYKDGMEALLASIAAGEGVPVPGEEAAGGYGSLPVTSWTRLESS